MPELPDVQVFEEYVDATSLHQEITGVHADAEGLREGVSVRTLRRRLEGRRLRSTRRHGKHLFLEVEEDGWLRLHFGMTGSLQYFRGDQAPEHTKLLLDFPDGYHLAYVNVRKFGEIGFVDDVDAFVAEQELGPDALDLDLGAFRERLSGRRGAIKGMLMNQEVLAGLGNEYTDEILFQAGIHPETPTNELSEETTERLHRCMREVVAAAVGARVEPERMPDDFLLPHRAEGEECPRCGRAIEKIEVSGRPTYLCPAEPKRS